jgi:hypothetical protein
MFENFPSSGSGVNATSIRDFLKYNVSRHPRYRVSSGTVVNLGRSGKTTKTPRHEASQRVYGRGPMQLEKEEWAADERSVSTRRQSIQSLICDDPRTKSACRQACGQFFVSSSLVAGSVTNRSSPSYADSIASPCREPVCRSIVLFGVLCCSDHHRKTPRCKIPPRWRSSGSWKS